MTESISISEFKATCLSVLENVRQTRVPVIVTRHGVPVAQILPPPPPERHGRWTGRMAGKGRILADLVPPAFESSDWSVLG